MCPIKRTPGLIYGLMRVPWIILGFPLSLQVILFEKSLTFNFSPGHISFYSVSDVYVQCSFRYVSEYRISLFRAFAIVFLSTSLDVAMKFIHQLNN